jgi:hypothetical protein
VRRAQVRMASPRFVMKDQVSEMGVVLRYSRGEGVLYAILREMSCLVSLIAMIR